jgi:L-arabinose isomerase
MSINVSRNMSINVSGNISRNVDQKIYSSVQICFRFSLELYKIHNLLRYFRLVSSSNLEKVISLITPTFLLGMAVYSLIYRPVN